MSSNVDSELTATVITAEEFAIRRRTTKAKSEERQLAKLNLEKRLESLEVDTKYGYVAFLLIGDLLNNVILNGGITGRIVEDTIQEVLDYFKLINDGSGKTELRLMQAMKEGVVE